MSGEADSGRVLALNLCSNIRQDPERLGIAAGEGLVHDFLLNKLGLHPHAGMVVNVFDNDVVVLQAQYSWKLQFHVLDTNKEIVLLHIRAHFRQGKEFHHGRWWWR